MVQFRVRKTLYHLLNEHVSIPQWFNSEILTTCFVLPTYSFQFRSGSIQSDDGGDDKGAVYVVSIPQWFNSEYTAPIG